MSALLNHESLRTPRQRPWQRFGVKRLFEGWQLGLLAVVLPLLTLWVVLPRPVMPKRLPLPELDRRAIDALVASDRARARRARARRLPFAVRRVGELVRRFGAASGSEAPAALAELRREFGAALAQGATPGLLELRALETELFIEAVRCFERSREVDAELRELAGNFIEKSRASRWVGADATFVLSEPELRTLYRVRWTGLVGAQENPAFAPSLEELRLYYRTLLLYPEGTSPFEQDQGRLAVVLALGRRDAEYPAGLARGILLLRLGKAELAADALTGHLADHPDGPHALDARNYLLRALAESPTGE